MKKFITPDQKVEDIRAAQHYGKTSVLDTGISRNAP